ncbi:hypothetical protein GIB67_006307 [Kingdonia uniflora]|uniref:Pentatricopeptide repeat-containing protein n=1 Tax=Kingdonia uniflora TaxID=39325 RepID=A0A7J7P5D0_9MAGN|nr:hypothetical protein GIB67_006307 [Kingdonia uniflora]
MHLSKIKSGTLFDRFHHAGYIVGPTNEFELPPPSIARAFELVLKLQHQPLLLEWLCFHSSLLRHEAVKEKERERDMVTFLQTFGKFPCLYLRFLIQRANNNLQNLRFCSSLDTSDTLQFDKTLVSELVIKQQWRNLKDLLKQTTPTKLLEFFFESDGVESEVVFKYYRWSEKEFNVLYNLELFCKLLNFLIRAKRYSEIRAQLHVFVKSGRSCSISLMFHTILATSPRTNNCGHSIIVDMLVLELVKNGSIDVALEAFERAGDYRFKLSFLSCNPLLNGLVKKGKIQALETVYKEIIKRRISPNLITFNTVINGLSKSGRLHKARDLFEDMQVWGILPTVITYNTLIDGYCKSSIPGKMYKAEALLKEMVSKDVCPSLITFNTLIDGYCKNENVSTAMKLFEELKNREDLKPSVETYNCLINGLCNNGKLDEALSLRDEMLDTSSKVIFPNVITYNSLINGFCKKGLLEEARKLFDFIQECGLVPSVNTYSTLMDGYCKDKKMEEAIRLRDSMLLEKDNICIYNCLIGGFCRNGNMEEANKLLDEMGSKNVKADSVTYNILIGSLCKVGKLKKAAKLLNEMFEMGLNPSHLTYNTLMDGYCMKGNLEAALNTRKRLEKSGRRANVATYNVLIRGLCQKGKLEEANGLLNEMLEKGLIPNRVYGHDGTGYLQTLCGWIVAIVKQCYLVLIIQERPLASKTRGISENAAGIDGMRLAGLALRVFWMDSFMEVIMLIISTAVNHFWLFSVNMQMEGIEPSPKVV